MYALLEEMPRVWGALLIVVLTLAIGFVGARYTDAATRHISRPKVLTPTSGGSRDTRRVHPEGANGLPPVLLPVLLIAALVVVAMAMGVKF